jgi:hypothetical protein
MKVPPALTTIVPQIWHVAVAIDALLHNTVVRAAGSVLAVIAVPSNNWESPIRVVTVAVPPLRSA